MKELNIIDLTDINNFYQLKISFLRQDSRYSSKFGDKNAQELLDVKYDIVEHLNEIPVFKGKEDLGNGIEVNIYDYKSEYIKESFQNDYLVALLPAMVESIKEACKNEVENVYGKDARLDYVDRKISKLNKYQGYIESADFLTTNFKAEVAKVFNKLRSYLKKEFLNGICLPERIPLKMSKIQIVALFNQLHENGFITRIHINDLMTLVDKNFRYFRHKKYHNISDSSKTRSQYFVSCEKDNQHVLRKLRSDLNKL